MTGKAVSLSVICNFLNLNTYKTKMLLVGPARCRSIFRDFYINLGGCIIPQRHTLFEPSFTFEPLIKYVTKTTFFNTAKTGPMVSSSDTETLVSVDNTRNHLLRWAFLSLASIRNESLNLIWNTDVRVPTRWKKVWSWEPWCLCIGYQHMWRLT